MNITTFKALTRIEQTLFGLPFLLAGALLPLEQVDLNFHWRWLWIFPAFMLARISGMAFNQLIDSFIDGKNPRTKARPIPSGRVSEKEARIVAWGSLALFLSICFKINVLCLMLGPIAALLIYAYSYLKRFTSSCHFVLGAIHFLSPVMASAAVSGSIQPAALFLGAAAACSIIGNDIVYAIQDFEFDRSEHLFSFPSRFGIEKSVMVARLLHLLCPLTLLLVGLLAHLPIFYYLLVPLVGGIFYKFHRSARGEALFFNCNVLVSASVFGFVLASVVWDVM